MRRSNRSMSLFVSLLIADVKLPKTERNYPDTLQSKALLLDQCFQVRVEVLRDFYKRTLGFRRGPAAFGNQNLAHALAQIRLNARQAAARGRFMHAQNRARFAESQVVEIIEFHEQTI